MPPADWRQALPRLAGPRLSLREVLAADAVSLFGLITEDPSVQAHISAPPPSIVAYQGFIAWCHRQRSEGQSVCFAVVPHGLKHAIGIFQIRALGLDFSVAEWGFALGSAFWSTGLFEEAATLVADFAFGTLGTFRLEGRAVTANGRGNGALLKIGASEEGLLREGLARGDTQLDQFMWSLLAEEWRQPACVRSRFSEATAKKRIETAIAEFQVHLFKNAPPESSIGFRLYPFFVSGRLPDRSDTG